ncbi:MAG: DNA topoisomerase 3 [Crocinitomicaceae bacterium]|nr:DNA topoisomerase 3 [Crocinitomicaceae bacterium]
MKVCIAEKPSVAREIADILGAKSRKDGYFEGNGYQVTWTFGHLCTLKEPKDYLEMWKMWNLNMLPMIPSKFGIKVIEDNGVQKQFNTIKNLVTDCEEVINCGDAGQEGELIQQWVLHLAQCKKPIKRLWISSLTEEAIKEGFENLKDNKEFKNLYAAGSSRAIGDWLLGINATRLFTIKYGQGKQVLSIGRVQTPTLAMIVNRQKEIENFKSEDFWEIKTKYRETEFSCTLGRIDSQEKADAVIQEIQDKEFEITNFEIKEGKEQHPRLFDLTSLQVECNKKFGFSADQTLKLIQSLYEKKVVTYPRVDTTYLSDDIYPKVPQIMNGLKYYSQLTEPLKGKPYRKSKKVFDNAKITDHHAIIPTGIVPSGITPQEQQVYDVVTKRFISVFYDDCIISNTLVEGQAGETEFKTSGKQILEPGWRVVYGAESQDDSGDGSESGDSNEQESVLPNFEKGEKGPHEPYPIQKQTQPPKYYTEATLLRAMETAGKQVDDEELRELMKDNGIGRPSTRANIIETLFRRRYIEKKRKNIHATITGVQLIDTIQNELLKSAELTGQWEQKLRKMEQGEYEVEVFKKELIEMVDSLCKEVRFDLNKKIELAPEKKAAPKKPKEKVDIDELKCPKCQEGDLLKGKKAYGCSRFKEGCDFVLPFEIMGKKLSDKQVADLITKKKTTKIKGFQIPGSESTKDGKLILDGDFNVTIE